MKSLAVVLLLIVASGARAGTLTGAILNEGVTVEILDVIQLPESAESGPRARVNALREAPDGTGRLFMCDLNGLLYVLDGAALSTYLDFPARFPDFRLEGALGTGLTSLAHHPAFKANGLLYTVHMESVGAIPAQLGAAIPGAVEQHVVLTEWDADDPAAHVFAGTSREVLRIAAPHAWHNTGEIAFDPTVGPGDPGYGLLWIGGGDFGSVQLGQPEQIQRLDSPLGTLLRIDPLGGPFERGGVVFDYGIPPSNPFAGDPDPDVLGEIYAYGFRNAHRLAWDAHGSGAVFVTDIGQGNVEEVNRLLPGANHGWPLREGSFALDVGVDSETVFALPEGDAALGFTYPVLQYDHEDGIAAAGGFPYRGDAIPQLRGKFVFGDIVSGALFYADLGEMLAADDGDPATTAQIYRLGLRREGVGTSVSQLVRDVVGPVGRADLRLGQDLDGELWVTTKQDGFVRRLAAAGLPACDDGTDQDGDGRIDWPDDPGCAAAADPTERSWTLPCDDGLDQDGDGRVDAEDPGCAEPTVPREDPACQDGRNNDPGQDARIDFDGGASAGLPPGEQTAPDPQCVGRPGRGLESSFPACGLGVELGALLPLLLVLARRRALTRSPAALR